MYPLWILLLVLVAAPVTAAERFSVAIFPSGAEFALEIAESDPERAYGYMFREHVGPKEGMLFLFETTGQHPFWMKNCKVPLDIIWLDAGFRVVEIVHEAQPCPEEGVCPQLAPFAASRYVLEVAGGVARAQNLVPGDRLVLLSEPGP